MISVLVVDDQEMIRVGLRAILDGRSGIAVTSEAADGFAALDWLGQHAVDVILMDLRMPGIDGVETIRRIRTTISADSVKIVVLTTFDDDDDVIAAIRAGANGFLSKGVGPAGLIDAIVDVTQGGGALSAAAASALIGRVSAEPEHPPTPDRELLRQFAALTPRERAMVSEIAAGLDYAQIAANLFLSPLTVKTHINRAMAKLHVNDRAQLVALAYRAGLVR